jgi:hypothetical protein
MYTYVLCKPITKSYAKINHGPVFRAAKENNCVEKYGNTHSHTATNGINVLNAPLYSQASWKTQMILNCELHVAAVRL